MNPDNKKRYEVVFYVEAESLDKARELADEILVQENGLTPDHWIGEEDRPYV